MHKRYPNRDEAEKLMLETIIYRREHPIENPQMMYNEAELIVHSWNVGKVAEKIAKKTKNLDSDKAYALGLLHDYGKRLDEKVDNKFHGLDGYEVMMKKGYPDVARVCMTHTFPDKNFRQRDFWYPKEWQDEIRNILNTIEYDDYDRLIQLSDKIPEGFGLVRIEDRMEKIAKRYNLDEETKGILIKEGMDLKKYFDELCDDDVYKIIGI